MTQSWFKPRRSVFDYGRPANWKGWAALLVFVFLFACLVQMIGIWGLRGFAPLTFGVWLLASLFVLLAVFLKLCNRFTPPSENISE
jgi:hypothetical protein